MWHISLILSLSTIITGVVYIIANRKKNKISPINTMLLSVFLADTLIFIPIYFVTFVYDAGFTRMIKTLLVSMHHSIRLFIVDSDFEIIKEVVPNADSGFYTIYTCYSAILFLLSPIMTFGFVFSFFKNIAAYRSYLFNYNKDVYVFSELNEKSFALAASIKSKFGDSKIVFTNYVDDSASKTLKEKVKSVGAIVFEKDVVELNFTLHNKKKSINFLILGDDETKNIKYSLALIDKYNGRKYTRLYVISNEIEGEMLLNSVKHNEMKVKRISDVYNLVFYILQNQGDKLFKEALSINPFADKEISAVIVGLGKHGSEMVKSLTWFCQMEGYRIEIDAFDKEPSVYEAFVSSCPELMDENHNNKFDDMGESRYRVSVHCPVNINSICFEDIIRKVKKTTYVFVSLGDDQTNIRAGIKLRMLYEQIGIKPRIQVVVESFEHKNEFEGIKNYSGQLYDIECVGAIKEIYSYENIFNSELEQEALKRHLCWGSEDDFWKYEYNYKSSMASALHKRMKKICEIPGLDKKPSERTDEEKQLLRLMEHRRWNAYMRSQGYIYAEKRNNLAKTHNCLVNFELLSQKEKEKDDD